MDCISQLYSTRAAKMKTSVIRELLKVAHNPEIISFAGGLPNPESFPIDDLNSIIDSVMRKNARKALQYGETKGLSELCQSIAERSIKEGITNINADNIVIMTGSQQALDIVGKMFLNPGDTALVGLPTYLGGINAFRSYESILDGIPLDRDGLNVDLLEEKLVQLHKLQTFPKLLYVIPNFQNPAGVVLSEKRRKKLIDIANDFNFLIIEDDPYGKLRYDLRHIKPIKAFDDTDRVIYMSTFSKILAPGFRLSWTIASEEITRKMTICKQTSDLCSSTFSQYIANEFIRQGSLDLHIMKICEMYRPKRDMMIDCIKRYFPPGYECHKPHGGMFAWVTLPEGIDTETMFLEAMKHKVTYVHGKAFHVDGGGGRSFRLNFSYSSNETIDEGIKRLGLVIEKTLSALKK